MEGVEKQPSTVGFRSIGIREIIEFSRSAAVLGVIELYEKGKDEMSFNETTHKWEGPKVTFSDGVAIDYNTACLALAEAVWREEWSDCDQPPDWETLRKIAIPYPNDVCHACGRLSAQISEITQRRLREIGELVDPADLQHTRSFAERSIDRAVEEIFE